MTQQPPVSPPTDTLLPYTTLFRSQERLARQNDDQAEHEAADDARLDETGIEAALLHRRMFGDIDRRAAIFAAERKSLQDAQADDDDRRRDADREIGSASGRERVCQYV